MKYSNERFLDESIFLRVQKIKSFEHSLFLDYNESSKF